MDRRLPEKTRDQCFPAALQSSAHRRSVASVLRALDRLYTDRHAKTRWHRNHDLSERYMRRVDQHLAILRYDGGWTGEQHSCRAFQDLLDYRTRLDKGWPANYGQEHVRHITRCRKYLSVSLDPVVFAARSRLR